MVFQKVVVSANLATVNIRSKVKYYLVHFGCRHFADPVAQSQKGLERGFKVAEGGEGWVFLVERGTAEKDFDNLVGTWN